MKHKIEILEFSLYENKEMEQLLHERALQGWFIKDMGRSTVSYEKGEPQDIYFQVDYFENKHLINGMESEQLVAYADFLKMYGCERVCGNGFRQIIKLPNKDFKLYEDEEKELLKAKCIKRDRRFYLSISILCIINFIISGLLSKNLFTSRDHFIGTGAFLALNVLYALPYIVNNKHMINRKLRKNIILILMFMFVGSIAYYIYRQEAWLSLITICIPFVMVIAILMKLAKKAIISEKLLQNTVCILSVILGVIIYNITFPSSTMLVPQDEFNYTEQREVENYPILVQADFMNGEVIENKKIETEVGKGFRYIYVNSDRGKDKYKNNRKLFSYDYILLDDQNITNQHILERLKVISNKEINDYVEMIDNVEVYYISETVGFKVEDINYQVSEFMIRNNNEVYILKLPNAYNEKLLKEYLKQIKWQNEVIES